MSEQELEQAQPTFLFNDYFSDPNDAGMEIVVEVDGKKIPFNIKRVLTLKEKQEASNKAVKIDFNEKGEPTVSRVDQGAYAEAIVLAGLVSWPYLYAPGRPVPINAKTVAAHDERINSKIAEKLLKIEEVQKEALAPFEKKSEEDSSQEGQQNQS